MTYSSRIDPIFNLPTPLLFGHRGTVAEAPESTRLAFTHAVAHGCDVLELDVQLTADHRFVVWHGPDLDNVQILGVPNDLGERDRLQKRLIYQVRWDELEGRTRVVDPGAGLDPDDGNRPLDRQLMLLDDFLRWVPVLDSSERQVALNIEPKRDLRPRGEPNMQRERVLERLADVLDRDANGRTVVVASPSRTLMRRFRRLSGGRYPIGVSLVEQLLYPVLGRFLGVDGFAFETTTSMFSLPGLCWYFGSVVQNVQRRGGSVHVFLTPFPPFPPLDVDAMTDSELDACLTSVLSKGIDGIMTDHPKRVFLALKRVLDR